MKKITTLGFCLYLSLTTLFGQKIDYDHSSKWFLGLNLGGTWQTTDVQNQNGIGWGLTLGRSFNYNYGRGLSFDIRGRYLHGYWYGQDTDTTSLFNYDPSNQVDPLDSYKDSLGFAVNNFRSDVRRLSLELVLHANRVREKTGIDPYIFGGIGLTWNQTLGDLYDETFLTEGEIYNYDPSMLNKSYLNTLMDGKYDAALEGHTKGQFDVNVMPSLGFGIGYQVGKRVTIGLEHKTTFTLVDDFDGFSASSKYNDIYHYTSGYIQFRFKTNGGSSGHVDPNLNTNNNVNNNITNCNPPQISFISPASSGMNSTTMAYTLVLGVTNISTKENLVFRHNGVSTLNFTYNQSTKRFESSVILANGVNTFDLEATNNCGRDNETFTVNYSNCQTPVIAMVNPSTTTHSVMNASFQFNALVQNVIGQQGISLTHNNIVQSNVAYDVNTGSVQRSLVLTPGVNTIVLTATNECGNDSETYTINFQNCVSPTINVISPSINGGTVTSSAYTLNAVVSNINSAQGVTVKHNNSAITNFNFNANNGSLVSNLTLRPGLNTFVITSTNSCGTDTKTVTVNYKDCIAPKITVTQPTANGSTVNSPGYTITATLQNIAASSGINLTHNNVAVSNFSFNYTSGAFSYPSILKPGLNTFVITVVNACGTETKTITINLRETLTNAPEEKITICHIPPGNNGNPQTIEIPLSAWPAHQAHGDKLGPCPTVETNVPEEKITICHIPPGNNGNPQTIEIPLSAWPAHQAHGDKLGPCPVEETNIAPEKKITICHIPPGNNGNPQTIEIPLSAWPAHQAHGDKLGPCPVEETNVPEEKITICHIPPGNNGNPQTIEIPLSAWPAHQAHGDKLGPCPVEETNVPEEKITICHIPPGNNGNPQTIEIPLSAWPAHQAHGDKLGPCPVEETNVPEEKITICHIPPGNNGNPQTIEIPLSAWPAHQAHGDKLGPCPVEETNVPEEKITICHIPPGNNGNPQTIEIPLSAWPAHQAHGDKLGPCPEVEAEEKITICHYPPGRNQNPQTIEIPLSAWPAHQAHGDKLGPCSPEDMIEGDGGHGNNGHGNNGDGTDASNPGNGQGGPNQNENEDPTVDDENNSGGEIIINGGNNSSGNSNNNSNGSTNGNGNSNDDGGKGNNGNGNKSLPVTNGSGSQSKPVNKPVDKGSSGSTNNSKPKPSENKPTNITKPSNGNQTSPVNNKPVETKPTNTRPVENKPTETKPVETKPQPKVEKTDVKPQVEKPKTEDKKPVETKPTEPKPDPSKRGGK